METRLLLVNYVYKNYSGFRITSCYFVTPLPLGEGMGVRSFFANLFKMGVNENFHVNLYTMFSDSYRFKGMRKALCHEIRNKGFHNEKILKAIEKIPRHFFLDSSFAEHAYEDKPFPIGEDQTISQPYTVAVQTELLDVQKNDKILEIGTGSGYQACILLELGAKVYSVELNRILYEKARQLLSKMNYFPKLFLGDGSLGLLSFAPYDKILVTAAAPKIPDTFVKQLKTGGRLVIPVGKGEVQKMICLIKIENELTETTEYGTFKFVPLLGKNGKPL